MGFTEIFANFSGRGYRVQQCGGISSSLVVKSSPEQFLKPFQAISLPHSSRDWSPLLIPSVCLFLASLYSFVLGKMLAQYHAPYGRIPAARAGSRTTLFTLCCAQTARTALWGCFFFNAYGMAYEYRCICKYIYVNIHTDVNNSPSLPPGPSLGRALHSPPLGTIHLLCMVFP